MKGVTNRKNAFAGLLIAAASGLVISCIVAAVSGAFALFVLLLAVLVLSAAGAVRFYKGWYEPTVRTFGVVSAMADGRFEETAPDTELGEAVNQVSVNTQEAFLLVWNHSRDITRYVESAKKSLNSDGQGSDAEILNFLLNVDGALEQIRQVISSFGFYGVRLEETGGEKDCAARAPGILSEHD